MLPFIRFQDTTPYAEKFDKLLSMGYIMGQAPNDPA